jgi:hypothetical protein
MRTAHLIRIEMLAADTTSGIEAVFKQHDRSRTVIDSAYSMPRSPLQYLQGTSMLVTDNATVEPPTSQKVNGT